MVDSDTLRPREEAGELRGVAALEAFLDDSQNRQQLLKSRAIGVSRSAAALMATEDERKTNRLPRPDVFLFNEDVWEALYDPNLPTLAFDVDGCFSGFELVAMAAQQRRLDGQASCNIVLFSSSTNCGEIATNRYGERWLEFHHGMLLNHLGEVAVGEFPQRVAVDVVETTHASFLRQCAESGIVTLNHPDQADRYNSKRALDLTGDVRSPQRYTLDQLWSDDDSAEYVIKPSSGSGGRGVRMFKGVDQKDAAIAYYAFLEEHGYEPIIEHRVTSWPLHKPGQDQRLDWNVRGLIANGELVDMYIRADKLGKPINRGQGAARLRLSDLSHYVDSRETATRLTEQLLYAGHDLARRVPTGMAGVDMTIGEDEQAYIYEINVGNTGGLQTIAELHDDRERKLLGPNALIAGWLKEFQLEPAPDMRLPLGLERTLGALGLCTQFDLRRAPGIAHEKLNRNITQLYIGLFSLGQVRRLANITEEELLQRGSTKFEFALWLESQYKMALSVGDPQDDLLPLIDKRYLELAPLEFLDRLDSVLELRTRPLRLLSYVAKFEQLFPEDIKPPLARIQICASEQALDKVREAAIGLLDKGIPLNDALDYALGMCTLEMYDMLGTPFTEDDLDPYLIRPIYARYLGFDYAGAMSLVHTGFAEAGDDVDKRIAYAAIGVGLALAERDPAMVQEYAPFLQEADFDVLSALLENRFLLADLSRPTIQTLIATDGCTNRTGSALGHYLAGAPTWGQKDRGEVADFLSNQLASRFNEQEGVDRFAQFLTAFASGESPSSWPTEGTLGLLAQTILQLAGGDFDIAALIRLIEEDSHLDEFTKRELTDNLCGEGVFWGRL